MKKVLFVVTGLNVGGAEIQVVNLADALSAKGIKVTIAYIVNPVLIKPSSEYVDIVFLKGSKSVFGVTRAIYNLRKLFKEVRPDIVHAHMFHANIITRLLRVITKFPVLINTAHSSNEGGLLRMAMYRITHPLCDVFTNVSQAAADQFVRRAAVPSNGIRVVYNGIKIQDFEFTLAGRQEIRQEWGFEKNIVFLAIGRIEKAKDYPTLIRSFLLVRKTNSKVRLVIVGDGSLREKIQDLIDELGLCRDILIMGMRSDIKNILSASDFFVLSSAWEGFGLVVAEAMLCERLVISTQAGGVGEVVGSDEFMARPGDYIGLANAMNRALELESFNKEIIVNKGRQRIVEKYDIEKVVQEWVKIYDGNLISKLV